MLKKLSQMISLCIVFVLFSQQVAWALPTERYAIIIGNNTGAPSEKPLKYAENDAKNIYDALTELGGFTSNNTKLLLGKDIVTLRSEMEQVKNSIKNFKRSGTKTKVDILFFYSGHSGAQGLDIQDQVLPISEIKSFIRSTDANVKIGIIDGCNSGTLVASKGANPSTPFEIDLHQGTDVNGEVFISSSTAVEKSLESSEVSGSFFTYFFVTGLRGDADSNGDGRISISEAYRYAYDHTVLKTTSLALGEQHPTYQFNLSGKGEYALTELSNKIAFLIIPPADAGKYYVYNSKGGYIISELQKKSGESKKIALRDGKYIIRKYDGGQLVQQEVTLAPQQNTTLMWAGATVLSDRKLKNNPIDDGGKRYIHYDFAPVENKKTKQVSTNTNEQKNHTKEVMLQKGELIGLRILENLNSSKAHYGDKVLFETTQDILVNGSLAIPAGSMAVGDIIYAKAQVGLARGEMALALRYVKAIDGQNIPLTTIVGEKGRGKSDDPNFAQYSQHYRNMDNHFFEDSFRYNYNPYKDKKIPPAGIFSRLVSLGLAVGISAALWGTNAKMKKGTLVNAFVDEDRLVRLP